MLEHLEKNIGENRKIQHPRCFPNWLTLGARKQIGNLDPRKGAGSFFAQSVHIKLTLPQAAWLSIFIAKISRVAPP